MVTKVTQIVLSLLFVSCASAPVKKEVSSEDAKASEGLLFPHGRYQQEVEVKVHALGHEKDFDFNAIIYKSSEEFSFYGYNDFGISLFKIRQVEGSTVEMDSSIEEIKRNTDFFLKVFFMVRTILSLRKADPTIEGNKARLVVNGIESLVEFLELNKQGIPVRMKASSQKQKYEVDIKTDTIRH
ncbi:MAG: hypothetical protein AB7O96_05490 [Pseudobdellovibrionaceae bacterium]